MRGLEGERRARREMEEGVVGDNQSESGKNQIERERKRVKKGRESKVARLK